MKPRTKCDVVLTETLYRVLVTLPDNDDSFTKNNNSEKYQNNGSD
jgi:hypothetical protein